MKDLMKLFLFVVLIFSYFACKKPVNKDGMALYAEIDRNAPANTITDAEKGNGWQLLFDGKNTQGWHGYNLKTFPDCWVVEDGCFTMTTKGSGESQDIITDKKYRSFAFSIDFKLDTASNSGIIFQVAEDPKYKFPYETGPEYQIIDQDNWKDTLQDWQICGANYAMYPPMVKPYKPIGEWNQALLVVDGNFVTQVLNGEVVVKYEKNNEEWKKLRNSGKWSNFPDWGKFDEGHISLQNHGTRVWYRNIKLKEF